MLYQNKRYESRIENFPGWTNECAHKRCARSPVKGYGLCSEHLAERIRREADIARDRIAYDLRPGGRVVWLYAIEDGEFLKFGIAHDVTRRFHSIQSSSPRQLTLAASIRCGEYVEQDIHEYLKSDHVRGEWFRNTPRAQALTLLMQADDLVGILEFIGRPLGELGKPRPRFGVLHPPFLT